MTQIDTSDMPALAGDALRPLDIPALVGPDDAGHPPRILLLYGSLRPQSYSRGIAEEGARVLSALGCETKFFDPSGLPLPDDPANPDAEHHPKVQELRQLALWSEGMVWYCP